MYVGDVEKDGWTVYFLKDRVDDLIVEEVVDGNVLVMEWLVHLNELV